MDVTQLDAVSAVLGAIAAGGSESVKNITKGAITGTRDRLVALVRGHLEKDLIRAAKLTVYAAESAATNGQALEGHLASAGIDQD